MNEASNSCQLYTTICPVFFLLYSNPFCVAVAMLEGLLSGLVNANADGALVEVLVLALCFSACAAQYEGVHGGYLGLEICEFADDELGTQTMSKPCRRATQVTIRVTTKSYQVRRRTGPVTEMSHRFMLVTCGCITIVALTSLSHCKSRSRVISRMQPAHSYL